MKKIISIVFVLLFFAVSAHAQLRPGLVNVAEEDGNPSVWVYKILFSNGSLTDNEDGTASVSITGSGMTEDGDYTPTGTWVWTSATVTWPTFNQNTSGNAATATALAANPDPCDVGQFVTDTAANGNLTCATPSYPTAATLHLDDLVTLSGVAAESTHLGTFTGSTITDNQTIKAALQLLETAVETQAPSAIQALTCTDSGDGNPGALTVTPTAGIGRVEITITVLDAHGCAITMAEAGAVAGTLVNITNISAANTATFAAQANILSLVQGSMVMASGESLSLVYKNSEWKELTRSQGTWTSVVFGGFTASTAVEADSSGNLASIADPNADKIRFWDDSATAMAWLAPDGSTIEINDTTLQIKDSGITAAKVAAVMKTEGACIAIGNGSDAIAAGAYYSKAIRVPFKATLTKVILTTVKASGALTIDVWIDAPGAANGLQAVTDADSLFDTATEPAIADASSDSYVEVTSFDSGENAIAAGDWIVVNADGSPTLTEANICFEFTRVD